MATAIPAVVDSMIHSNIAIGMALDETQNANEIKIKKPTQFFKKHFFTFQHFRVSSNSLMTFYGQGETTHAQKIKNKCQYKTIKYRHYFLSLAKFIKWS
ncbi:hypothetical protein [Methylophaga muralis]|uniref:hypothetical protein n=1 Tax=Methylophaga muralis TaxID=291169 RepID=UPI0008461865|nr:hypothetical protein [Methylophaga muralis]